MKPTPVASVTFQQWEDQVRAIRKYMYVYIYLYIYMFKSLYVITFFRKTFRQFKVYI